MLRSGREGNDTEGSDGIDAVVVEDVDRWVRDQGDYHTARKRLDFLGTTLHSATGKVTKADGTLRALMSEMAVHHAQSSRFG